MRSQISLSNNVRDATRRNESSPREQIVRVASRSTRGQIRAADRFYFCVARVYNYGKCLRLLPSPSSLPLPVAAPSSLSLSLDRENKTLPRGVVIKTGVKQVREPEMPQRASRPSHPFFTSQLIRS
ncbi:hypothetical protein PUN28_003814 [Cardiocondyla obscurior]|uniref:Uncharacterized protein n=1 Tax=Cardiocondyla obscurior TaxID=286306 RepID=A0AAW2GLV9_9HYME